MQQPFKVKLKHDAIQQLYVVIAALIERGADNDDDKLVLAVLSQIKHRLYVKLDMVKTDYQMTLSPPEAIALRILSVDYVTDKKSYLGNKLHQIANQIHKQYI